MKTLVEELVTRTPQCSLSEAAREYDVDTIFSDGVVPIELKSFVVTDSFKSALDFSRDKKKVSLAVFGRYFLVIFPDARWMQSLRIYQSIQEDLRIQDEL